MSDEPKEDLPVRIGTTKPSDDRVVWSHDYLGTCSDCHRSINVVGGELAVRDCHWCKLPVCAGCRGTHNCVESHALLPEGIVRDDADPTAPPRDYTYQFEEKDSAGAVVSSSPAIRSRQKPTIQFVVPPDYRRRWSDEEKGADTVSENLTRWSLIAAVLAVVLSVGALVTSLLLASALHLHENMDPDAAQTAKLDAIERRLDRIEQEERDLRAEIAAHAALPSHAQATAKLDAIERRLETFERKTR